VPLEWPNNRSLEIDGTILESPTFVTPLSSDSIHGSFDARTPSSYSQTLRVRPHELPRIYGKWTPDVALPYAHSDFQVKGAKFDSNAPRVFLCVNYV